MENRPTEPGIWIYETDIDPDLGPDAIRIIDLDDVEHIEIMYSVTNWLGKAVPPKRVERLDYNEDPYGFDLGRDLEPSDNGPFVRYQDVREYLVD